MVCLSPSVELAYYSMKVYHLTLYTDHDKQPGIPKLSCLYMFNIVSSYYYFLGVSCFIN